MYLLNLNYIYFIQPYFRAFKKMADTIVYKFLENILFLHRPSLHQDTGT